MSAKLLINEPPLQVLPSLATYVGLNEAIFLQQVHYWLTNPKLGREVDGQKWVHNSLAEWQAQFPFWDENTIRRTVRNLEGDGLLLTRDDLNQNSYDRTKWYSLDYSRIDALDAPVARIARKVAKRRRARAAVGGGNDMPPPPDKMSPPDKISAEGVTKCQDGGDKMSVTIPKTPTEIPSENHTVPQVANDAMAEAEPEPADSQDNENLVAAWSMLLAFCKGDAELAARVWQLQLHFKDVSKIAPDIDTHVGRRAMQREWWPALLAILTEAESLERAKETVGSAVRDLDSWKPAAVSAPSSVEKKAKAIIAGWRRKAAATAVSVPAVAAPPPGVYGL